MPIYAWNNVTAGSMDPIALLNSATLKQGDILTWDITQQAFVNSDSTAVGGHTITSVGSGDSIISGTTSLATQLKSISGGSNISITSTDTDIVINGGYAIVEEVSVMSELADIHPTSAVLVKVNDKGDGEWGLYLFNTIHSNWVKIATQESAESVSFTGDLELGHTSGSKIKIVEVSSGGKVDTVTVEILETYDGDCSLTIGSNDEPTLLFDNDDIDMSELGIYETEPSKIFLNDEDIYVYVDMGNSTKGRLSIKISTI